MDLDMTSFRNIDGLCGNNNNNQLFRMLPTTSNKKASSKNNEFDGFDKFDNNNTIIGMPMRSLNYKSDKKPYSNEQEEFNHIDFNLYDKATTLNVLSYDSNNQLEYSEISNFGSPLLSPLKQSPEYFMCLMINCLAFDLNTVMNSVIKSKFYCISPLSCICSLNFVYSLYRLYDITNNSLIKFFQNKSSEYVNTSLIRLSSDIKNFTNFNYLNIALVNDTNYKQHAQELNKYVLGTCFSLCINTNNNQIITHQVNNIIKQAMNKQIDVILDVNNETLKLSNDTGNTLFLYNFNVFIITLREPFLKKNTRKGIFKITSIDKKFVNYMLLSNVNANYYQNDKISLLELECTNSCSFGILITHNVNSFKYQEIEFYIKNLKITSFEYILIPKIKYQTKIKLNEALKKIGLDNLYAQTNTKRTKQKLGIFSLEHYITVLLDDTLEINDKSYKNTIAPSVDDRKIKFKANKPFVFYTRTINNNCINLIGKFN